MKRRDFLAATSGLAGAFFVRTGMAQSKPCPPGQVSIGSSTTASGCGSQLAGPAPAWFVSMPERTWVALQTNTLESVRPDALPLGKSNAAVCTAWTGGCIDQSRGELILAANGGHGDYAGNEVYACSIRGESPRWYRLTDPTPDSLLRFDDVKGVEPAANGDGRMRAVHGWNRCTFANGRVWYTAQDAYTDGNGNYTCAVWSFDRNDPRLPSEPTEPPLKHDGGQGPWASHGMAINPSPYGGGGGPAAFDPIGGRIWSFNGAYSLNSFYAVDVASGTAQKYSFPNAENRTVGSMWAAVAPDLRILVVPNALGSSILVLDLDNPGAGLKEVEPLNPQDWDPKKIYGLSTGRHAPQYGAVYHAASKSFLIHCPGMLGRDIRVLRVPLTSGGAYDPRGQFSYSTIPGTGAQATFAGNFRGAYSKFNVVQDMGNGQSALVLVTDVTGPVYVYKLPVAGV